MFLDMTEDVKDTAPGDGPGGGGANDAPPGAPDTPASPIPADVEGVAETRADATDYKDKWLRTEAEMQNFRRRTLREREDAVVRAQDHVLLDVITVLDDLERALASLTPEHAAEAWVQGVTLTAQRMRDTLTRWDVAELEAAGKPFDPAVHEAMLEIEPPPGIGPGEVAQVIQKGYRRGGRTLRAARVIVARAAQADA
jgi:molecular chaperone GrpE